MLFVKKKTKTKQKATPQENKNNPLHVVETGGLSRMSLESETQVPVASKQEGDGESCPACRKAKD